MSNALGSKNEIARVRCDGYIWGLVSPPHLRPPHRQYIRIYVQVIALRPLMHRKLIKNVSRREVRKKHKFSSAPKNTGGETNFSIRGQYTNQQMKYINKKYNNCYRWVVIQKLPHLSDTHFSQVLNKLKKNFFHGFIKYHLALHFI